MSTAVGTSTLSAMVVGRSLRSGSGRLVAKARGRARAKRGSVGCCGDRERPCARAARALVVLVVCV